MSGVRMLVGFAFGLGQPASESHEFVVQRARCCAGPIGAHSFPRLLRATTLLNVARHQFSHGFHPHLDVNALMGVRSCTSTAPTSGPLRKCHQEGTWFGKNISRS